MIQKLPGKEKNYFPRFLKKKRQGTRPSQKTFCNSQTVNKVGYLWVLGGFPLGISHLGK